MIKPPSLPRLPLVGSTPWLIGSDGIVNRLVASSERFRGAGAFGAGLGPFERLMVINADLATELCDDSRFEKAVDGPLIPIRRFAGDGLFTAFNDEPNWHLANRILTPGFSSGSMQRYFPAMRTSIESLLDFWRRSEGPVDVVRDMTLLTLDTIALTGFDQRFDTFDSPTMHPFLVALGRALQEAFDSANRVPFITPLMTYKDRQYERDIQTMFEMVDRVIAERRVLPEDRWPSDFLSLMLSASDPKTGESLSAENIRYQILTFLIAGHETTANLLSFILHRLAHDAQLATAIRTEIDARLGAREPTFEDLSSIPLIQRTLSEGLRLWPTVPILGRVSREDTVIGNRFAIEKGQNVLLLLGAVHRDPAIWQDPERFDPDRFVPERVKARPTGAYRPFGIGKRACTGRHFALVEASLCLIHVLREFELEDPGALRVAPTLSPKPHGLRLRLRRRGTA